jgi:beta-glucanase (GH16 family)
MRSGPRSWIALAAGLFLAVAPRPAVATYQPVWADEFDGAAVDPLHWEMQLGDGCPALCGWGNAELQYYQSENAIVADGELRIVAREESVAGYDYSSARMRSKDLADFELGRIEMRARMPVGQGLWPAFWMLFTEGVYGTWAASGEIDILEYLGHNPDRAIGTIHYGDVSPGNVSTTNDYILPSGSFDEAFHTFAIEWEACRIRWFVDDNLYATETAWNSTGGPYPAPFDEKFHLLLNLAVGGNFPGPPDMSTIFPQQLVVDHVRVLQKDDYPACRIVFDDLEHAAPFSNGWFSFPGSVGGGGISANLGSSAPLDDGCSTSLATGWGSGGIPGFLGGFGRTNPVALSEMTHFSFWINPAAGQDYTLEINLQDDDDGDDFIPSIPDGADDEFQYNVVVSPTGPDAIAGGGWQRVSIPLANFVDDNTFHTGGNGILDAVPTGAGGNGQLVNVVVVVVSNTGADANFDTDDWRFSQEATSVGGRIWNDADLDGVIGVGESGLSGVTVELRSSADVLVDSTPSLSDGSYTFENLPWGWYSIKVNPATLSLGLTPTNDPDGIATAHDAKLLLGCAADNAANNFGFGPTPAIPSVRGAWIAVLVATLLFSLLLTRSSWRRAT